MSVGTTVQVAFEPRNIPMVVGTLQVLLPQGIRACQNRAMRPQHGGGRPPTLAAHQPGESQSREDRSPTASAKGSRVRRIPMTRPTHERLDPQLFAVSVNRPLGSLAANLEPAIESTDRPARAALIC